MEITELENGSSQLEQLSPSDERHRFLQNFLTLCSPLSKDGTVSLLRTEVDDNMEWIPESKLKRMRARRVVLTLDLETACSSLSICQDDFTIMCVCGLLFIIIS